MQLMQSDSCSTSFSIEVEAMALLILTALRTPTSVSSVFGYFGTDEWARMVVAVPALCVYATQLGLVVHLFFIWSENVAGCEQKWAEWIVWSFTASVPLQCVC